MVPHDLRRIPSQSLARPLAVFAVALLLRLLHLAALRSSVLFDVLVGDAAHFDAWARRLVESGWSEPKPFYVAPLYPWFLGLCYELFGPGVVTARLAQAVLGATGCALVSGATRRFFSPRVGLVTGLLLACYGPGIWLDGLVQKSSLAFCLLGALLACLARVRSGGGRVAALGAGLALGGLALTRENAAVLLPLVALWLLLEERARPLRERAVHAGLAVLAFTAALAPFALHDRALGAGLRTSTNVGVNFYIGNGPAADGLYVPLRAGRGDPAHERADARRLAEEQAGRPLSAGEVSAFWLARGIEHVRADPGAWARLLWRKLRLVWHGTEIMDAESLESHRDASRVLDWSMHVLSFGVLVALAAVGLWATRSRWRELWLFHAALLLMAGTIVLFFVTARFRFVLVPLLAPFAASALVDFARQWRARELGGMARSVAIAALAILATNGRIAGLAESGNPRAATAASLTRALLAEGRVDEALEQARYAVARDPELATARFNLGIALARAGQLDEAERELRESRRLEPAFEPDVLGELGTIAAWRGDLDGAERLMLLSIALDPDQALVHHNLGLVRRLQGRLDEAIVKYRDALRLDPDSVAFQNDLAYALALDGRAQEARNRYQAALALDPDFEPSLRALAWLLATHPDAAVRDGGEALRLARHALELAPEPDADLLDILAAAQAEVGRFEQAAATAEKALAAAEAAGNDPLAEQIRERLARYGAGRAWRER